MGLAVESNKLNSFQYGVGVVGDRLASAEGINKASKLGVSIINLVGKIVGALSEGWQAFSNTLRGVAYFLDVTDLITRIAEWIKGEVIGAWKIASRVFLTVFRVFGLIEFLEKVKLINLRSVVEKLGNVPVIGWIINLPSSLLGLVSFSLSLVHYSIETRKYNLRVTLAENRKIAYEARLQYLREQEDPDDVLQNKYIAAVKEIRNAKAALNIQKWTPEKVEAREGRYYWSQGFANTYSNDTSILRRKIKVTEVELSNAIVKRGKSIVGIVNDIFKVAIIALSLLGLILGGILLATALPMLIFGVAVSAMGLYKCFHEAVARDYMQKLPKDAPESAQLAQLR